MKYMKTFESYGNKLEEMKKEIIDIFQDCFKKWKLKTFTIAMDTEDNTQIDYYFSHINKENNKLIVDYEIYTRDGTINVSEDINDTPANIVIRLYDLCEEKHRFTGSWLLETLGMSGEKESFIAVMKDFDNLDFYDNWILDSFAETEKIQEINNDFNFQDILLSRHPNAVKHKYTSFKFLPEIKEKYKHLFDSNELGLL